MLFSLNVTFSKQRKRGADILFSGDSADAEVKEVLWRVNFSEFLRHFRHKVR